MSISSPTDTVAPASPGPGRSRLRIVGIIAAIASTILLLRYLNLMGYILSSKDWIAEQGAFGAVVFAVVYIVGTVFALPASILTLVAGGVYGLWKGFLLVSFCSTAGATGAFLIARYVARDWIAKEVAMSPKFRALDEGVAQEGWKLVILTRLSPLFPFNLQNYGYGLTSLPLLHYVFASWIGMMPGTLAYVYIGYVTGSLVTGDKDEAVNVAQTSVLILGLVATIAVTFVATRIAQRALARITPTNTVPTGTASSV